MTSPLWPYSDPDFRERWKYGLETVNLDVAAQHFKNWSNVKEYTFLKNEDTDKIIYCLNSKRGNDTYARKQKLKFEDIQKGFDNKVMDFPSARKGFRDGIKYRFSYGLFITFTIDQNQMSDLDAWKNTTRMLNQFKAILTKKFGSHYASLIVKEANGSGYPAPHMIVLLDKPVEAFLHRSNTTGKYSWRIQDQKIVNFFHDAWARYSMGSFLDIQAIVDGSIGSAGKVSYYITKYISKSVDLHNKTALYTHTGQKLFNLRDMISASFRQRLDIECVKPITRLDTYYNELKLLKKQQHKLEREMGDNFNFYPDLKKEYDTVTKQIETLKETKPKTEWQFLDSFRVSNQSDIQKLLDLIMVYTSKQQTTPPPPEQLPDAEQQPLYALDSWEMTA